MLLAMLAPLTVQKHGDDRNPRDEWLLTNPRNSSNLESMHNRQNDYNRSTRIPFVYQSPSPKYHEPIKDREVNDNYDPNISEWVDENYPRTSVYNDAQVNVLEEALPYYPSLCVQWEAL